ncbi:hypothetical protein QX776_00580 [Alteromonadaceae bacterium BrNp21-10]|nr:hypothetical protein [Alteromonadaceae bacterium BrNp21-10]
MSNNHNNTIADAQAFSEQIYAILAESSDDVEFSQLLSLVESRDKLINTLLESLDEAQKKALIEQEIPVNEDIQKKVAALFKQTENQLSKFVRDQKSVKKYK